nr:hypothetical protein [Comamonas jiangduensis]
MANNSAPVRELAWGARTASPWAGVVRSVGRGAQALNNAASSTDAAGKARGRAKDKKDTLTETG